MLAMMPFPTITVVTPCRNAADTIERTLLSVVTQAGDFIIRLHVQDGGSTDGTLELLERWQRRLDSGAFPIQCRGLAFSFGSAEDRGMYDALVKAFAKLPMHPSDFMTWINADDLLMPGALALIGKVANGFTEEQVSWLAGIPSVLKDDVPIVQVDRPTPTIAVREGLCDGKYWDFVQQEGTFFRRWLWDIVEPAKNFGSYRLAGDWNLWRLFAQHAEYAQVPWPLGSFRLREGQLSRTNADAYMAEIESTITSERRSDALRSLAESGGIVWRMIKARYPSGRLYIVERVADGHARRFYHRNFGHWPARPYDPNGAQTERLICEERDRPASACAARSGPENVGMRSKPLFFDDYTYARQSHWKCFEGLDIELFGEWKDPAKEQLKVYQDLLVLRFIRDNVPPGSRILDVGGGVSRILAHLAKTYECWNIDKLEGLGNGPRTIANPPYRLVRDYMGNFNPELPDNYFDLVFSISALEHVPQDDKTLFDRIIADIDRVLKPGGLSLHLFDVILKPNSFWTNKFTEHIFAKVATINKPVTPAQMRQDPDFYAMSEEAYNKTWLHTTKRSYDEHGRPSSLNILWRKREIGPAAGLKHAGGPVLLPRAPGASGKTGFFVVTPCLNVAATIDRTIESVVSQQGGLPVRYHVQDGGSTDGTLDRLRRWADLIRKTDKYRHISFSWSSAPDHGMYDALSLGFDSVVVAPDDFLTWINGDDVLMRDAFVRVARIADARPDAQWVGGSVRVIDEADQVIEEDDVPTPTAVIREGLCDGMHWNHLQQEGMFFRKSLWFRAKHALRGFRFAGDWSLWREFARHAEYYHVHGPLGAFRRRAGQISVARRSDYLAEIENSISVDERKQAFEGLYTRHQDTYANVVQMLGADGAPVVERRQVDPYFERFMTRAGLARSSWRSRDG